MTEEEGVTFPIAYGVTGESLTLLALVVQLNQLDPNILPR